MSNDKIINLETFQVLDENSNYIIVDELIADTIAILNKKGYETLYSCSGHGGIPKKELFINRDIKYLEEVKKDRPNDIAEIRENDFDYWFLWTYTTIYIKFDKKYEFSTLPDGFILEDDIISHDVEFYVKKKRRNFSEIDKEIETYNKILYEWASKLPDINERNDKNE